MKWRRLTRKIAGKNPIYTTEFHRLKLPNGKTINQYLYLKARNGVNIVALTKENKIILVEQYRYAINKSIITLPGGFGDAGESLAVTASRELLEETGYRAGRLKKIGIFYPLPGNLDQKTVVFLASDCFKANYKFTSEDTEYIKKIKLVSWPALVRLIKKNDIQDGMSLAALRLCLSYLIDD